MKRLLAPVSIAAMAGMLWGSVTPAYGCSCGPQTPSIAERLAGTDAVIVATVVRVVNDEEVFPSVPEDIIVSDVDGVVRVEKYLKGTGPLELTIDDPPTGGTCGFIDQDSVGHRLLLMLSLTDGTYKTHACMGNTTLDNPLIRDYADSYLGQIEAVTGAGTLPSGGGAPGADGHFPLVPTAALVILGPLTFLAGAAFLWRRGEPHNG